MYRAGIVVIISSLIFACSAADPNGTPLDGQQDSDGGTTPTNAGNGGACTTSTPPAPMDPSTLPTCCPEGKAHCVPTDKVPVDTAKQLSVCTGGSGGVCVPDPFVVNPSLKPPSCKSLGDVEGVCLSVCVTQVHNYKDLLPQATCAADERCAPCISPIDKKPTGACDIGKSAPSGGTCAPPTPSGTGTTPPAPPTPAACPHTGAPVLDPNTLPSCDPAGGAHCLSASLVPPAMASQLAACPTGLCVPDPFIAAGGNFIPPTCRSLNDAEGRCLHESIPQVASQKGQLPQASCATFERCVPCFNPLDGKSTGSCNLSCDPGPKEPPKLFKQCCTPSHASTPQGRCISTSQIPAAEQKNLSVKECTQNVELCVPSEMVDPAFRGTACSASNLLVGQYTGVCLSTCLSFGIQGLAISQGDCDNLHKCAPCKNPLTGQSTGAPGCPP